MKFVFNSIDGKYYKVRPEYMGDIQPKFWFASKEDSMLVKRQHSQKVVGQPQKSKMFNHFGEYFGYLLAEKAGIEACPVDLITLHDTKNKYSQTVHFYTACGSRKLTTSSQTMMLGEHVVAGLVGKHPEQYKRIISDKKCFDKVKSCAVNENTDNVDVIVAAIISQTAYYERHKQKCSEEEIKQDIQENLAKAFEMIVYDCLFGNNDRHAQNWSMYADEETGKLKMYPLYDNERILGLSKPEAEVKRDVRSRILSEKIEEYAFSRMGISPSHSGIRYQKMLEHIVENYPQYAIPAIQKITDNVTEKDIEEMYDAAVGITSRSEAASELTETDELPIEYKAYGMTLYSERRTFARDLLEKSKGFHKKVKQKEEALIK